MNVIYPKCCPVCHRILKNQSDLACATCIKELIPIQEPRCKRCGKPVREEEEYCKECGQRIRAFDRGKGIFVYDDIMKKSILRYKYGGRRQYGDFYAKAMCVYAEKDIKRWEPDLIVPIPLHRRKQRRRGFNQAEYLADRVGDYYKIPVDNGVLKKVRDTKSQKKMDAEQRRRNLQDAFKVIRPVKGKKILVIDDVYTTGSTMDAAARCLKNAGAHRVYYLTVCMGIDIDK